jgi:DNA-binding NtrC family response regulator
VLPYRKAKKEFERAYIEALMAEAGGSIAKAAQIGKINRTYLYAVMARCGIQPAHPQNRGNALYIQLGR